MLSPHKTDAYPDWIGLYASVLRKHAQGRAACRDVHFEGTIEPELSFELARRNGIDIPYRTAEEMIEAYDFYDLPSFLEIYYAGMRMLRTEDDFHVLTWPWAVS